MGIKLSLQLVLLAFNSFLVMLSRSHLLAGFPGDVGLAFEDNTNWTVPLYSVK